MSTLNAWRSFAERSLDEPAPALEFLARIAPTLPKSRVDAVAELLADPLARWVRRPVDVRRVAAVIQQLPLSAGTREELMARAEVADARFGPFLTRHVTLPRTHGPADVAASQWRALAPQARTQALDELLASLKGSLGNKAPRGRGAGAGPGTKAYLVDTVAEISGLSRAAAARAVDAVFDPANGVISQAVHKTGRLSLPGFGTFTRKTRGARQGRNPLTGATIEVPERTAISFAAAKGFIEKAGKAPRTKPRTGTGDEIPESSGGTGAIHVSFGRLSASEPYRLSRSRRYRAAVRRPTALYAISRTGPKIRHRSASRRARLVGSRAGGSAGTPAASRSRAPARGAARPERTVSNGFSAGPGKRPLPGGITLQQGREYAFWLQVGRRVKGSIARGRAELDTRNLEIGAVVDVVLFPVGGAFQVLADLGQLRLAADGTVGVARQPGEPGDPPARGLRARRLFFPIRAPEAAGEHRLRCNLYHGQTLLQSWLIRARVTPEPRPHVRALRSRADYVLSQALDPARLESLSPHRLSVLFNGNGDGTHGFFFKAAEEFRHDATLDGQALADLITTARGLLRKASWNDEGPWTQGKPYLYDDGERNLERLRTDLERLARRGLDFYDALTGRLTGSYDASERLRGLMRTPGMVQIASRESAAHVVPAAIFYDRTALDRGSPASFTLCPAFLRALDDPRPLEAQPCFRGECISEYEEEVVCPSGFWGFRHAVGMPLSVGTAGPDVEEKLAYADPPGMAVAVWRDFVRRAQHETVLKALRPDLQWEYADTRKKTLALLASTHSPVVYFYCHGGVDKRVPYLLVGEQGEGFIAPSSFRGRIRWTTPRPLVFINGCETGALEPETALEMVSALVERANASGVIGTEITIFEPLACEFAEEFLRRFLVQGQPLGEAVRGARLALLKRGNPLGLVYIPFAIAGLRMDRQDGV